MKRTQIYLDEEQDEALARRAAIDGRTKSELIRDAVNQYLGGRPESKEERLRRFRETVRAVAGVAPYLPAGDEYVRELRKADLEREREIEARWHRT